jgi:hypothetical protein
MSPGRNGASASAIGSLAPAADSPVSAQSSNVPSSSALSVSSPSLAGSASVVVVWALRGVG